MDNFHVTDGCKTPNLLNDLNVLFLLQVLKARVKDLMLSRYKIVSIVHIGQLKDQGLRMGSRCLWDQSFDTFTTYEYRNKSLFAVGTVYGIYAE